jgi:hypothetical protein
MLMIPFLPPPRYLVRTLAAIRKVRTFPRCILYAALTLLQTATAGRWTYSNVLMQIDLISLSSLEQGQLCRFRSREEMSGSR